MVINFAKRLIEFDETSFDWKQFADEGGLDTLDDHIECVDIVVRCVLTGVEMDIKQTTDEILIAFNEILQRVVGEMYMPGSDEENIILRLFEVCYDFKTALLMFRSETEKSIMLSEKIQEGVFENEND